MHERMKYINELVRNGVRVQIITPTILLDRPEKREALEYLEGDDELDVECFPVNDDDSLIEITRKQ